MKGIEYRIAVAAALTVLLAQAAFARTYQLSVTRKDRNIYKVDGKSIIVKTRYCYEYVYSADAILRMSGRSGELIFLEEDHSCDVEAVYEGVTLDDGRYSITVSHEDDNWYRIDGAEAYIQTSMCLNLALGQEALLKISGFNRKVYFLDDEDSCPVEAIFRPLKL